MRQWMLRITAYADRLLEDLKLLEWPESLKEMQRNWIGKSVGAEVDFEVAGPSGKPLEDQVVTVFTTRPDTLYGATYMVLAPEHPLVKRITTPGQKDAVERYKSAVANKSERDRMSETKEKTGVFTGAYAVNPVNDEKIPVWIADYVLMGYGTGAIMAVPAHDERDFAFAKKFGLPIKTVVRPVNQPEPPKDQPFIEEGVAINSPLIEGLATAEAKEQITAALSAEGIGFRTVKYKLRDWLFSRQRYWGEPFPILLDEKGNAYAVEESELPIQLPEVDDFKPTGTPEPPLSKAKDWVRVERNGKVFHRETNTMPQWAGSCWYYLRYIDPHNEQKLVDPAKEKYWMPVDLYVGGVEHAVLHLLYARFWHKVLFDLKHVSTPEPFHRLVNQGLILGETEYTAFSRAKGELVSVADLRDVAEEATAKVAFLVGYVRQSGEKCTGKRVPEEQVEKAGDSFRLKENPAIRVDARSFKMSKSRGNVVNPDVIVRDYGADCFRLYEMYMGPLEAPKPWNTRDIVGMSRFLNSAWRNLMGDEEEGTEAPRPEGAQPRGTKGRISDEAIPDELDRMLHRTIKKVGEDIEGLRFNTAIAELIKLNNEMGR
ncbi:MAG TPA: leucine--tRNA ligase, partial [Tepidisphaeraceae bacterium]|nr:leucine--tRNA ligase [Tepidisphaeraceae bacterium]